MNINFPWQNKTAIPFYPLKKKCAVNENQFDKISETDNKETEGKQNRPMVVNSGKQLDILLSKMYHGFEY